MGPHQLWLLLLLCSGAWTQDDGSEPPNPACPRDATRFKHLRKYVYNYEAETANMVKGTADSRSGSKINCKVELEVPQLCNFLLRTSQCSLREVSLIDPEGKAVLRKAKNSDEFASAMSRQELKFTLQEGNKVQLYPEEHESLHILNIKRGIISALIVPVETEDNVQTLSMDTVYGKCDSDIETRNRKGNVAADITIRRNLRSCSNFNPFKDYISPIALIKGMNVPLSSLISSNQLCEYTIDGKRKHVSEATCTEKHLFLPSSYKNEYGMVAQITQTLRLEDTPRINNRDVYVNGLFKKALAMESVETKSAKSGDAVLKALQEVQKLSVSQQNEKRANLFYRFVTGLRGLHSSALDNLVPKMVDISSSVTIQALTQCGTPECFGAILQILRTGNIDPLVANTITYSLGLLPSPSPKRIWELLHMAQYLQSRASFYALSLAVDRFYKENKILAEEITDVANFMTSIIGNECSGDEDLTYLTLRAIGNMGKVMEDASPSVKQALKTCIRSETASLGVQKAAIQALRKMALTDEDQGMLLRVFQENASPVDKRLAAYLMLMRNPSTSDVVEVTKVLLRDKNKQVKSFVASHVANILDSEEPELESLKGKVQDALKGSQVPATKDFRRFSQNYRVSETLSVPPFNPLTATLEGNVLFEPSSYVPKESMLKATLQLFGLKPLDLFEIGLEGKNFEPTLEAVFGPKGFLPDSATKALYWIDGKVPDEITNVLFNYFGYAKGDKQDQDVMNGIILHFEKLVKAITAKGAPEAKAYLSLLNEELGYVKLSDLKLLGKMILGSMKTLQAVPETIVRGMSSGAQHDLFVHYIFMDNACELPTGAGLQLQVAFSGVATPGAKMQAELAAKPSVAIEFVTHLGVNIPEFASNGVQMNTHIYHESGIEARLGVRAGQLKLTIPAPKTPTKLFSISNIMHLISPSRTDVIPALVENRESWTSCRPFLTGLNYCTRVEYSNASATEAAPYYPLTGDTRFEIELQPTGEVTEYTASANYELKKEGNDLIDTLSFTTTADVANEFESRLLFRYNRGQKIFTSDLQVPRFSIDCGTNFRVMDESTQERQAYTFILDINNQRVPEVTLTGRIGYKDGKESMLGAVISIPRLQTQARTEALLERSSSGGITFQIDSSATAHGSSIAERIVFIYDEEKFQVQWNSGTSAALKKASLPVDLAYYSKALHKRTSELLDHKVANTDMTLHYIVSHFMVATNNWLQRASTDIPYAQTLQDKLRGLQELNLSEMGLFTVPEELFLKSDGQIKYMWNKDSVAIRVPLPLGGRSSHDMGVPERVRTPPLGLAPLGINMPSQEFRVPSFTIPESYTLQVPLLGTFEMSSNVYSNYYNWSAAYSLANTTKDATYSLRTRYYMRGDCILDLLDYNVQGQGEASYDQNMFTSAYESSLQHSLLNSNLKVSKTNRFGAHAVSRRHSLWLETASPLGVEFSLSADEDGKCSNNLLAENVKMEAQLKVASTFAKTTYTLSSNWDANGRALAGESNLKFDSSYLQATNQMTGRCTDEAWTITSTSNVQNGFLTNTASLNYENSQLKLASETNGRHENLAALNKFEFTAARQGASLRSEYQASYLRNQYSAVLSGFAKGQGAELNAEVSVNGERNKAAHKSTLSINKDGLASSATTKLHLSPLMLESEVNARIGTSGATIRTANNGHYGRHKSKFNLDGRLALTEIMLESVFQSSISDVDSNNLLKFRINKEGLKFSNHLIGAWQAMKLEHTQVLSMTGMSFTYTSNLDHTISPGKAHKHHVDFDLQPYSFTANMNNDLKYGSAEVTNEAQLQLEPVKVKLNGNMKGSYGNDEVKHTYTFNYADLVTNFKTDTVGNIQGAALTHAINLDIAGLSSTISVNTNCDSKSLRFSNVIRSLAAPFTVTVDMHTNSDGRLVAMGEHTGQLYSKFLLKVEPLAFLLTHDYKGSTGHNLDSANIYTTLLDNKIHLLFTPSEQTNAWKLKSQLNKNVYMQEFSAVNNAERIGVELSGQTVADLSILDFPIQLPFTLSMKSVNLIDTFDLRDVVATPQEFGLSLAVKYDKNTDVQIINLPFLENLPAYYEQIRQSILSALKAIQNNLKNVNIDQYVGNYKATLDRLPQQVNDYVDSFNLESQVNQLKDQLDAFTKDYTITVDDLQLALGNAKKKLQEALAQLQMYLTEAEKYIQENYDQYDLRAAIAHLIDQIVGKMKVLDRQYQISATLVDTIQQLQAVLSQYDLSQIGSTVAAWIESIDTQYKIRAHVQDKLDCLKTQIQSIDAQQVAESLKQQLEAIDLRALMEKLKVSFPVRKISDILEQVKDIVLNLMEDYEVAEKINAFQAQMHKLIVNYELDQRAKVLMDKMVELCNQNEIKETIQKVTLSLKKLDIKYFFNQGLKFIDDTVKQLQTFDYNNLVDEVNRFLDVVIKKVRAFDYNKFVDETNLKVREVTQKINEEIRAFDLPQKVQAAQEYLRELTTVLSEYVQDLKDTRLAAIVDWFTDLLSSTTVRELKAKVHDYLEDVRDRLQQMDIPKECQRHLEKASQAYGTIVTYLADQWTTAAEKIARWAEQHDVKNLADNLNRLVETGFIVPEIRTGLIHMPAFEVSLRALQKATFQTPAFMIPFTDLHVPSYEVNMKTLKDLQIPVRFTTPEFTILNIKIPSFTIDLNDIKLKIVRMVDQIMSSDFQLPAADIYFQDLKMKDLLFADFSFPEIDLPELQIPELLIPKLNLNDFQFPDIQIPEFQLPRIPHSVTVPTFGKLSGTFRIASPYLTLTSTAGLQNTTTFAHSPDFAVSLSTLATSKYPWLGFTLTADAHLSAPEMQQLILKEILTFSHMYLKADHVNEVIFLGTSVQGNAETTTTLGSASNNAELYNKLTVHLQRKISMESKTKYTHKLHMPHVHFTSQAGFSNLIKTELEAGHVAVTSTGTGDWKWDGLDYSDEGTHDSRVSFTVAGSVAAFVAENKINAKYLQVNQRVSCQYDLPSFARLQVASTVESPQLGQSVLNVQGTGDLAEMKTELRGIHNAKLKGHVSGTIKNELAFLVQPLEISTSAKNEMKVKVSFPLKLTGKIDVLNNYNLVLSPSTQQVSWETEGRFNHYKYAHHMTAGNYKDSIDASVSMNGEANLDFLSKPVSIPELYVPYIAVTIPQVREYSLWEETGLKNLLKTPKQSFDFSVKAQYTKNKAMHSLQLPLDGVHRALNHYITVFNRHFEKSRDNALAFLTQSYNQAKTKFDQYKVDHSVSKLPKTFRMPGYTVPVINLEVSPFTAELPAFGYIIPKEMSTPRFTVPLVGFSVPSYTLVLPSLELPVLHVPQGLRTLKLPSYQAQAPVGRIYIPALGNATFDFSFKSSVITLNTNAGIFNQSDIIARLSSSCTSVIDELQYKLDATTSLTRKRGLKLATALSLSNRLIEGKHDSTISLTRRNIDAAVLTTAKVNASGFTANFGQELKGNMKAKPIISSVINVNYVLDPPTLGIQAKGALAHKLTLDSMISDIVVETSTNGFTDGVLHNKKPFSGKLTHEANLFLNAKAARSSVKLEASSKVGKSWSFDMKENVAVEASSRRIFAVWDHHGANHIQYFPVLVTRGNQDSKLTLQLTPAGMSTNLQMQASQPNHFLQDTSTNQVFGITINAETQKLGWKGNSQFLSLYFGNEVELENGKAEARFGLSGSFGGHISFLRRLVLPVYDRSLWDVLKLDATARPEERQYLNASMALIYTKNEDGYFFSPLKVDQLADGFTVTIPEIERRVPNPVVTTPEFKVPFTTLQIPSYMIDLRKIKVPETLSTMPFDIQFPALPKIQFPQLNIATSYVHLEESKIPYLELTVPEYLLTVSPFTLPKMIPLGNHMFVDLNAAVNKIADFDLPTITVPEQQIEIPALKLALPTGLYIPKFGALTGLFRVASPVYSITWQADIKNKKETLEYGIDATANSPLQFLEYDLDAVTTWGHEGVKTQGTFSHPDLSMEYQEVFIMQGLGIVDQRVTLDITSPTFTDVQMRYRERSSEISSTVSSSSAGTIGYLINVDTDVLKGKLFYRTRSNPQNDVDIFQSEISFQNPELIQVKANWQDDAPADLLQSFKEKVPPMADAVYQCVNKYHNEHMGMDISTAALKVKEHLRNTVDKAYRETVENINELENQLHEATNQVTGEYERMRLKAKQMYREAADQAGQIDYEQIRTELFDAAMGIIKEYHQRLKRLIDSATEFLKITKFQVPGLNEKYTGEELYVLATGQLAKAVHFCISKVQERFDDLIAFVNEIEVKIPASSEIIKGSNVLNEIKELLNHIQHKVGLIFAGLQEIDFEVKLKELKELLQQVFQKAEELIRNLQSQNYENIKAQANKTFVKILEQLNSLADDIKYLLPRFENIIRGTLQDAYAKIEEFLLYMNDLRKEYFDPSIVGWSVQYYEIEQKVVAWLKNFISAVVDWHVTSVRDTTELVLRLTDQLREFVANDGAVAELSKSTHDKILDWSEAAKSRASAQHKRAKATLQESYDRLRDSYGRLIAETQKLMDLIIENYTSGFQYLFELLNRVEQMTADALRPYVAVRQGELRLDIPIPFDFPLFYQRPQFSAEDTRQSAEGATN